MYKYVRNDLEDSYGILPLQDKILEIMVYIDSFCKEHNITYYLMGGSALGAIRHGGFIPWDDDLDIFMTYDNYVKFAECCEKYLDKDKFYFQKEDTEENPYFFSKIRMNGTTCYNPILPKGHQGIFVDIMCLNNAPSGSLGKKVQYYAGGLLKASALLRTNYSTESKKKKIELLITRCIVTKSVKNLLLHLVRKYNSHSAEECAHVFGRAKFANSFYDSSYFGEGKYVPFEQVSLCVPDKAENYLADRYGSRFMEMPDEKTKALYASHASLWSIDQDYKEFIKKLK